MTQSDDDNPSLEGDLLAEDSLEPTWSSELSQRVYRLVYTGDLEGNAFQKGIDLLVQEHGDEVFVELLYLLCHLRFEPEEARNHWQRVHDHRQHMAETLRCVVDLRVAQAVRPGREEGARCAPRGAPPSCLSPTDSNNRRVRITHLSGLWRAPRRT